MQYLWLAIICSIYTSPYSVELVSFVNLAEFQPLKNSMATSQQVASIVVFQPRMRPCLG